MQSLLAFVLGDVFGVADIVHGVVTLVEHLELPDSSRQLFANIIYPKRHEPVNKLILSFKGAVNDPFFN